MGTLSAIIIGIVGSILAQLIFLMIIWIRKNLWSTNKIINMIKLVAILYQNGLTNFYESRAAYARRETGVALSDYLALAKHSITIIGLWLGYGVKTEEIAKKLEQLIKSSNKVNINISLLNPKSVAVDAVAGVVNMSKEELQISIRDSLFRLSKMRSRLYDHEKERFNLKVHDFLPMGSAIIIDSNEEYGRFQLELKPYKVESHKSFGLELRGKTNYLYKLNVEAWENIINNAEKFDPQKHIGIENERWQQLLNEADYFDPREQIKYLNS